jgi:hypothetical protein
VCHQQSENEVIENLWTSCWVWLWCFFSLDAMDLSIPSPEKEEKSKDFLTQLRIAQL